MGMIDMNAIFDKDLLTVRETLARAKADGFPISEYALRQTIKNGVIPVYNPHGKGLIYYPAFIEVFTGRPYQKKDRKNP